MKWHMEIKLTILHFHKKSQQKMTVFMFEFFEKFWKLRKPLLLYLRFYQMSFLIKTRRTNSNFPFHTAFSRQIRMPFILVRFWRPPVMKYSELYFVRLRDVCHEARKDTRGSALPNKSKNPELKQLRMRQAIDRRMPPKCSITIDSEKAC